MMVSKCRLKEEEKKELWPLQIGSHPKAEDRVNPYSFYMVGQSWCGALRRLVGT